MRIYLDYAASTPVAPEVFDAMKPFFLEKWGNASSLHSFGREAEIALDESRETIARFFGVGFEEVYFTSGATEANNWIIKAVLSFKTLPTACAAVNFPQHSAFSGKPVSSKKPHIVTSMIEHESLLEPIRSLEEQGFIEATYLRPSGEGMITPQAVEQALKQTTGLVSIMYVNNETGGIQPIREIASIVKKFRETEQTPYPIFHTDAAQAIQFLESRLDYLNVDAMTVSSHKVYGPKGVGALIAKKGIPLPPLLYGGGQEAGKRSGTENIPGVIGFAKAIDLINDNDYRIREAKRLSDLKEYLIHGIVKNISGVIVVGSKKNATHIASFIFPDIESQVFLIALDQEGIAVSSGSACSIKAMKPSYVLQSFGYAEKEALHALRFSLGRYTTKEHIETTIQVVSKTFKKFSSHKH